MRSRSMSLGVSIIFAGLLLAACAPATPEMRIVQDAATALGGADKIKAAQSLVIEGAGDNFNLGQNMTPEAPLPQFKVTDFKKSVDLANGRARLEQVRTPQYPTGNPSPQKQILGIDGEVGFNVGADGQSTRIAELAARDRRAELMHHPIALLRAALAEGTQLKQARQEDGNDVVDVVAGGETYTLHVNSTTKLPARIVSMTYNVNLGDVAMETSFDNYQDAGGLKVPGQITSKVAGYVVASIQATKNTVNGDVGDLAATAAVKSAPAPVLTANVQSSLIAPGVWYLDGQSHHSVLVEFADHLTLIEAPQNEVRTLAVIKKARELKPDKPLKYVINTHHHFDHSGGLRAAVAEGLTVITHDKNRAFVEDIVARKHTLMPDALAKAPKRLSLETVSDKHVIKDSMHTIELYPITGSPHAETLLMVYFPAEGFLVQADVFTPPAPDVKNPPPAPFAPNLMENVQKRGLRVQRIVPIHGRIVPMKDMEMAAAAITRKTE